MNLARLAIAFGGALWLAACGGGNGGGTAPPSPPTKLVKTGGDGQSWYFNNPLPTLLSVTALDANNRGVPGVVVNWGVALGGGGISPAQSTTDATGVASAADSVGSQSLQSITATPSIMTLQTVTFNAGASAPPTSAAVDLINTSFSPKSVVVKTGGTVTWTWKDSPTAHNVTFVSGPALRPPDSATQATGTQNFTFTTVGTYNYVCTVHGAMTGTITVVR